MKPPGPWFIGGAPSSNLSLPFLIGGGAQPNGEQQNEMDRIFGFGTSTVAIWYLSTRTKGFAVPRLRIFASISARASLVAKGVSSEACEIQPPTSEPFRIGPNNSQVSPLKRCICICLTGAKSVGLVLTMIPGKSIPTRKS